MNKNKAFTLAEIMIVFTVIGILTAILVPTLFQSSPDQEKLRAKKAFNTLTRAVENLMNSGPYSVSGVLTAPPDSDTSSDNGEKRFFCNNLAEVLNVRNVDCTSDGVPASDIYIAATDDTNTQLNYGDLQSSIDSACDTWYNDTNPDERKDNFVTADGIAWGVQLTDFSSTATVNVGGITTPAFYGVVCFDAGKKSGKEFAYGAGIRRDGKVVVGEKLQTLIDDDYTDVVEQE